MRSTLTKQHHHNVSLAYLLQTNISDQNSVGSPNHSSKCKHTQTHTHARTHTRPEVTRIAKTHHEYLILNFSTLLMNTLLRLSPSCLISQLYLIIKVVTMASALPLSVRLLLRQTKRNWSNHKQTSGSSSSP